MKSTVKFLAFVSAFFSFGLIAQNPPAGTLDQDPDVAVHHFDIGRLPVVFSTISGNQLDQNILNYIEQYKASAVAEMYRSGVPASITLAQGIFESGAGKSELAVNANNHFGIKKGMNWNGPTYPKVDDDRDGRGNLVPSLFRVYPGAPESYKDHSDFLLAKPRYAALFSLPVTDYRSWANGLVKAGYATDQRYGNLLIKTVDLYGLNQFDATGQPVAQNPQPVNNQNYNGANSYNPAPAANGYNNNNTYNYGNSYNNNGYNNNNNGNGYNNNGYNNINVAPTVVADQLQKINNRNAVVAGGAITLEGVASRYGVPLQNIQDYNEQTGRTDAPLPAGTIIFLEKKRNYWHGDNKYHTVKRYETMYSISQMYGILLDKLYSKNEMPPGAQPDFGAQIILRRGWFQSWKTPALRDPSLDNAPQSQPGAPVNPAYSNNYNNNGNNYGAPQNNGAGVYNVYQPANPAGYNNGAQPAGANYNPNGGAYNNNGANVNNGNTDFSRDNPYSNYNNDPRQVRPVPTGTGTSPANITPDGFDATAPSISNAPAYTPPAYTPPAYTPPAGGYDNARPPVNNAPAYTPPANLSYGAYDNARPPAGSAPAARPPSARLPVYQPSAPAIQPVQTSDAGGYYIVKPKETLYGIARMFHLTVDQLKQLNNLTENTISIGQSLKIR